MYITARLCYNIHVWPLFLFYPPRIVKKMSIIFYDEEAYFEKISWRFKREYVPLWADKQIDS